MLGPYYFEVPEIYDIGRNPEKPWAQNIQDRGKKSMMC